MKTQAEQTFIEAAVAAEFMYRITVHSFPKMGAKFLAAAETLHPALKEAKTEADFLTVTETAEQVIDTAVDTFEKWWQEGRFTGPGAGKRNILAVFDESTAAVVEKYGLTGTGEVRDVIEDILNGNTDDIEELPDLDDIEIEGETPFDTWLKENGDFLGVDTEGKTGDEIVEEIRKNNEKES